ncbi:MAG: YifB family Mg chelatase-like AAA ATPase [Candidatus Omnitrophota bacterium]|nr:YifB family Mg chelatase-like AAA ATPase [Candidatus Omnitrophota bacterium]
MISAVNSLGIFGCNAYLVRIEVDVSGGLPGISIVGLPDQAIRESRDRIKPAIKNSGLPFPYRRITVNLAPAEIRKEGPSFDLAVAVALVATSGIPSLTAETLAGCYILGELSLQGEVRRVRGVLPMAVFARENRIKKIILPRENAPEAAIIEGLEVYPVSTLSEAVSFLQGELEIAPFRLKPGALFEARAEYPSDFSEVRGQEFAKRALEVAVAGGHNIVFVGPPGAGKTMLAKRVPSILPFLTLDEMIETSKVYSLAGLLPEEGLIRNRPFRSPHHTVSDIALIGGGSIPKPGEVSLAHNGVLFLDELPEFDRSVLEVLRQPLEEGLVHISRAKGSVSFPASFILIAAMNPCPCGNLGNPRKSCRCPASQIAKYRSKLSGPLLDRIDLHVEVPPVPFSDLSDNRPAGESSQIIRNRIQSVRQVQAERYCDSTSPLAGEARWGGGRTNASLTGRQIKEHCLLTPEADNLLKAAMERFSLSARSYDKLKKVGRTIADLDKSEKIEVEHISEAIQYRALDRKVWV